MTATVSGTIDNPYVKREAKVSKSVPANYESEQKEKGGISPPAHGHRKGHKLPSSTVTISYEKLQRHKKRYENKFEEIYLSV